MLVGFGNLSCATWLSTSANRQQGNDWLLGFWSGINGYGSPGGIVGHTTDSLGIISEVKKVCNNEPSLALIYATARTYQWFAQQDK